MKRLLIEELIGSAAGILSLIAFMPQVMKIYRSKSGRNISAPTFIIFGCGAGLWIIYGGLIISLPIIVTNTVILALAFIILALKAHYGNPK